MKLSYIIETALYAENLAEANAFYEKLLGTAAHAFVEDHHVFFKLSQGMLLIFNPDATSDPDATLPRHGATGPGHMAFRVAPDEVAAWKTRLGDLGIAIEQEYTWPNAAPSLYFRDPAGNVIEITINALWGFQD